MNQKTQETVTALAFIATVLAIAGIWFTDAPVVVKLAATSMLFVLWAACVALAGRDHG